MSDLIDPVEVRVRSLRRWSLNGFDELVSGLFSCGVAAIYPLERALMKMTFVGQNYEMIAPYLQLACCLAMVVTVKKLRAKLIFPRTGYVEFHRPKSQKWMMAAIMFVLLGLVFAIFAVGRWRLQFPDMSRAAGPALALVLAACFVSGGITYGLPDFRWLAGLSLVLGAATYIAGAKMEGGRWVTLGTGVPMAAAGAIRLRVFLQTHPILQTPAIGEDHHA
jgi:hypothetical protein